MQTTFAVTLLSSESLLQMPGDWTTEDYRQILTLTDYGDQEDMSDREIQEMAFMTIADLPKPEAAELLMEYVFADGALTEGQRKNSSHEMDTERLWEEYPEPRHHANFFRVGSLLYAAFNGGHPKPDGRRLVVQVAAKGEGADLLQNPDPALVLRLLAPAMDGHALLHRLYEDELNGASFPAAANLLYRIAPRKLDDGSYELTIDSTDYWLADYRPAGTYEVAAAPDGVAAES